MTTNAPSTILQKRKHNNSSHKNNFDFYITTRKDYLFFYSFTRSSSTITMLKLVSIFVVVITSFTVSSANNGRVFIARKDILQIPHHSFMEVLRSETSSSSKSPQSEFKPTQLPSIKPSLSPSTSPSLVGKGSKGDKRHKGQSIKGGSKGKKMGKGKKSTKSPGKGKGKKSTSTKSPGGKGKHGKMKSTKEPSASKGKSKDFNEGDSVGSAYVNSSVEVFTITTSMIICTILSLFFV